MQSDTATYVCATLIKLFIFSKLQFDILSIDISSKPSELTSHIAYTVLTSINRNAIIILMSICVDDGGTVNITWIEIGAHTPLSNKLAVTNTHK